MISSSKNPYVLKFSKSLEAGSVTEMKQVVSPLFAPLIRNSIAIVVLPEPTVPASNTVFPSGNPPLRIVSNPVILVSHFSRGVPPRGSISKPGLVFVLAIFIPQVCMHL